MTFKEIIKKMKANPLIRALKPFLQLPYHGAQAAFAKLLQIRTPFVVRKYDKLHLGCGPRRIADWANIDISGYQNIVWDLRKRLPVTPGSIRFIYSEHFIEHISRSQALELLRNCRAVLAKGGGGSDIDTEFAPSCGRLSCGRDSGNATCLRVATDYNVRNGKRRNAVLGAPIYIRRNRADHIA